MRTILFVCTGNTCRSPMAEAIARHCAKNGLLGEHSELFMASAGVFAGEGNPTTHETLTVLHGRDIEHEGTSTPLNAEMVKKADLVLCMTASHQQAIFLMLDKEADREKILILDPAGDIEDPIGLGLPAYDDLAQRLLTLIPKRLKEVLVP